MPFTEAIRLALQTIWHSKLRSFFTLLGIIVSVGFLVVVVAVIQGMNAYVKENLTGAMIGTGLRFLWGSSRKNRSGSSTSVP
jgi:putative ABC transport system permease protein